MNHPHPIQAHPNAAAQQPEPVSASDVPHDHYDSSSSSDNGDDWIRKRTRQVYHAHASADSSDNDDDENGTDSSKYNIPKQDELYNPNGDEEDEAFVYQHLRGGVEETISVRRKTDRGKRQNSRRTNSDETVGTDECMEGDAHAEICKGENTNHPSRQTAALEQAKVLKPRSSDAVLSCPCCFQIVCMDCQRHENYSNQFRAMFVMNIGVSWDKHVTPEGSSKPSSNGRSTTSNNLGSVYNEYHGPKNNSSNQQEYHQEQQQQPVSIQDGQETYYSVHCNNCYTEVAALDMTDEVYHFFGCLVSA